MMRHWSRPAAHLLGLWTAVTWMGCEKGEPTPDEAAVESTPTEASTQTDEPPPPAAAEAGSWNYPAVHWVDLHVGLERMNASKRPGMVVVKAEWCPRCKEYKALFSNPELLEMSKSLEMILVDQETSPEAANYFPVGNYVPRTLFLTPNGTVDEKLVGPNPKYPHFLSGRSEKQLLSMMDTAIQGAR